MPRYPNHDPQPYTGTPLTMVQAGPSDMLYTGGTAPSYQSPIDRRYGRQLAGGQEVQDEAVDMDKDDHAWAGKELESLAELDDVQGSGIFDPPGSHPNIHPDAGVFAAAFSIPGYHARERMFSPSEVVDSTTGRRVVPVPSGAVAIDSAAAIALLERNQYGSPESVIRANAEYPMPFISTANVVQHALPVGSEESPEAGKLSGAQLLLLTAGVGLAAAAVYSVVKRGRRKGR